MTDLRNELQALTRHLKRRAEHPTRSDPDAHQHVHGLLVMLASTTILQLAGDDTTAEHACRSLKPPPTPGEAASITAAAGLRLARDIALLGDPSAAKSTIRLQQVCTQFVMAYVVNGEPVLVVMGEETGFLVERMLGGEDILRDLAARVTA